MFKRLTVTSALVAAGLVGALGSSAIAQTRPATSAPASSSSRNQISALDRQFVMDAAHGGIAEVKMAQLALQKSTNPEVKQFAQQMIAQHTPVNKELMRLAAQKGIAAPTDEGPKYKAAMMRVMQMSGESFDKAYMSEGGVNGHLEAAAVYQRQTMMGQDPDLKAFAAKILPAVQGHLEMASTMTGYRVARDGNTMPGMTGTGTSGNNTMMPGMTGTQRGNTTMPGMTGTQGGSNMMPGMNGTSGGNTTTPATTGTPTSR